MRALAPLLLAAAAAAADGHAGAQLGAKILPGDDWGGADLQTAVGLSGACTLRGPWGVYAAVIRSTGSDGDTDADIVEVQLGLAAWGHPAPLAPEIIAFAAIGPAWARGRVHGAGIDLADAGFGAFAVGGVLMPVGEHLVFGPQVSWSWAPLEDEQAGVRLKADGGGLVAGLVAGVRW
jgi:hypothetical protein